ncbi:MAG TPA: sugar ABC transporter permease [Thermomicrobiales bacterium]|nr:sugar ABC transporter permease [Thermomicrobiales bacterium]
MAQTSVQAPPRTPGGATANFPYTPRKRGPLHWIRRHLLEIVMVTPLFLYILYFMFIPVAQSIYYSFVHAGAHSFTLDNYRTIIGRSQFNAAFTNTLGMTLMGVTMEMVIGISISLMLVRAFRGRGIFRTIVLLPLGIPTIVSGAAMLYFIGFNGYLNKILLELHIIDVPIYWQQSGWRGMLSIALADVWKSLPLVVLILVAGLEGIPEDVYEAASLDGANGWHRFVDQTLPLLMPSITMALILRAIDAFRIFDIAMVLAGQSVPVMSTFVYTEYANQNVNTAAAAAVILLLMIIVFVLAYFFLVERRSEVER